MLTRSHAKTNKQKPDKGDNNMTDLTNTNSDIIDASNEEIEAQQQTRKEMTNTNSDIIDASNDEIAVQQPTRNTNSMGN